MISNSQNLSTDCSSTESTLKSKTALNIFAPEVPNTVHSNELKQQYENYTNMNKDVDSILKKVCQKSHFFINILLNIFSKVKLDKSKFNRKRKPFQKHNNGN
jgi:hypothetical protein